MGIVACTGTGPGASSQEPAEAGRLGSDSAELGVRPSIRGITIYGETEARAEIRLIHPDTLEGVLWLSNPGPRPVRVSWGAAPVTIQAYADSLGAELIWEPRYGSDVTFPGIGYELVLAPGDSLPLKSRLALHEFQDRAPEGEVFYFLMIEEEGHGKRLYPVGRHRFAPAY